MSDAVSTAVGAVVLGLGVLLLVVLLMGLPLMWLWNATIPDLFPVSEITFWEAVRLGLIGGILFKTSNVKA